MLLRTVAGTGRVSGPGLIGCYGLMTLAAPAIMSTLAVRASARPCRVAKLFSVMADCAKMFPEKSELLPSVAELPTTQYTLSGMAPPARVTVEPTAVVSALSIVNVHLSVAKPVSVRLPVNPADVEKMMAALPDKAPAKPRQPRKVLVLAKAAGYVHSCIPLVAKTVEALGAKTGAWTTAITYDPAAISEQNLKQYDVLFLDNTTGAFLDDPHDAAATAARRKALLEFVRSGKGLAGIHAAGDSYHEEARVAGSGGAPAAAASRAGGPGAHLASQMLAAGDTNKDQKLSREELSALADAWFAKLDAEKAGRVSQAEFVTRFASVLPPPPPAAPHVVPQGRDTQVGTWPEFDHMIGGFFKFHWVYPQLITTKIDDPKSPLTAMFHAQEFDIHDETYTFGMDTWSRTNLHILTSIDYDKMSDADKAKEEYPRADHDYGLSWIHREGKGRVFYEAHGHSERVYAIKPMLEHVLAGVQYALGDLKADDSPSVKPKK